MCTATPSRSISLFAILLIAFLVLAGCGGSDRRSSLTPTPSPTGNAPAPGGTGGSGGTGGAGSTSPTFLYAWENGNASVWHAQIDASGALVNGTSQSFSSSVSTLSRNGSGNLLTAVRGGSSIGGFSVSLANGTMTESFSAAYPGALGAAVDSTGEFVAGSTDQTVDVFRISGSTAVKMGSVTVPNGEFDFFSSISFHPNGRFIYRADIQDRGEGALFAIAIDRSSGALTLVDQNNYRLTGIFSLDPKGDFIYRPTAGQVRVVRIDQATGKFVPSDTTSLNSVPGNVAAASSTADMVFVANGATITSYRLDRAAGTLAPLQSVNTDTTVLSMWVERSGSFLYAGSVTEPKVFGFRIDSSTGAMTPVQGTSFGTSGLNKSVRVLSLP
jgi:hypothetical protein